MDSSSGLGSLLPPGNTQGSFRWLFFRKHISEVVNRMVWPVERKAEGMFAAQVERFYCSLDLSPSSRASAASQYVGVSLPMNPSPTVFISELFHLLMPLSPTSPPHPLPPTPESGASLCECSRLPTSSRHSCLSHGWVPLLGLRPVPFVLASSPHPTNPA